MKYENYDMTDKIFWKIENQSGEALVKFAKEKYDDGDNSLGNELLHMVEENRLYIAKLEHELKVAKKYMKMAEKNWQNFYEYVQEKM